MGAGAIPSPVNCSLHTFWMIPPHTHTHTLCSFFVPTGNTWLVIQLLSDVRLFVTPWTAARQASLSFIIFWNLLKLMSIESVIWSNHLVHCHSLFLLPSIFPSIRVFSNESALCISWSKYWSFSFNISPSHEYSGLISFQFSLVQSLSRARLFVTPWIAAR